jgi:hypothetical protein
MDIAVVMRPEVLADKIEDGRVPGRALATWNTRRLPTRLTPGWTNRLFVASQGTWRGYFPLSGEVFWSPRDLAAPYALIFDPRKWTSLDAVPVTSFRGWRYLAVTMTTNKPIEAGSSLPRTS